MIDRLHLVWHLTKARLSGYKKNHWPKTIVSLVIFVKLNSVQSLFLHAWQHRHPFVETAHSLLAKCFRSTPFPLCLWKAGWGLNSDRQAKIEWFLIICQVDRFWTVKALIVFNACKRALRTIKVESFLIFC